MTLFAWSFRDPKILEFSCGLSRKRVKVMGVSWSWTCLARQGFPSLVSEGQQLSSRYRDDAN